MEQPSASGAYWETHCYITLFVQAPKAAKILVCVVPRAISENIAQTLQEAHDSQAAEILRPSWEALQEALARGRHTKLRLDRSTSQEEEAQGDQTEGDKD